MAKAQLDGLRIKDSVGMCFPTKSLNSQPNSHSFRLLANQFPYPARWIETARDTRWLIGVQLSGSMPFQESEGGPPSTMMVWHSFPYCRYPLLTNITVTFPLLSISPERMFASSKPTSGDGHRRQCISTFSPHPCSKPSLPFSVLATDHWPSPATSLNCDKVPVGNAWECSNNHTGVYLETCHEI